MNAGRRAALLGVVAVFAAAGVSRPLAAQNTRGTVIDSASRQPISGAVVTLLDANGAVLGQNITNELGEFGVTSGRAKAIRVVRIGFQPRTLTLDDVVDSGRSLDVAMSPFKTTLAPVRVLEQANCPSGAERAAAVAYWDQARAGLLNAVVARKTDPMAVHRLYFQRALSAKNDSITSFAVFEDSSRSTETSFTTVRSARDLVRLGFSPDTNLVGYMFGPDADILLDDAFAEGYCFRLAAQSNARPHQVGLAFAPADFKRGRVDIAGTLWVDTAARTLHDVEFRYIGMRDVAERFQPGGTISFATSASGVTFINRWTLRLFGNTPDTVPLPGTCPRGCIRVRDNLYPTENGAEVSHAVWKRGQRWDARLGLVSIRATTGAGRPAVGTLVQLHDAQYRGTTDTSGIVLIRDLLPGPYALRVHDQRVEALGFLLPTPVTFTAARDSVVRLTLSVPTVEGYATGECRKRRQWKSADSTYIVGRVVDSDKKPVAGARVSYALQVSKPAWEWSNETARTGDDGMFQFCSSAITPGENLRVRASRSGYSNADVTQTVKSNTTVVRIRIESRP